MASLLLYSVVLDLIFTIRSSSLSILSCKDFISSFMFKMFWFSLLSIYKQKKINTNNILMKQKNNIWLEILDIHIIIYYIIATTIDYNNINIPILSFEVGSLELDCCGVLVIVALLLMVETFVKVKLFSGLLRIYFEVLLAYLMR